MSTLLHIDSSPLYGRSVSRPLTDAFVTQWKSSHPDGTVVDRDLTATPIPPVTAEWVGPAYTSEEARTPQPKHLIPLSITSLSKPPLSRTCMCVRCLSRRPFRTCKRTRRQSKATTHENGFYQCALFAWTDVYSLWPERISQLYPPAAAFEPACATVLCCHQRVAFCRVLLRGAVDWRAAFAFGLLCTASAYAAGGRAL